jgi:hypothetical protein
MPARSMCEAILFEAHLVVGVEVVEPYYGIPAGKQALGDMETNKACRAGDENMHDVLLRGYQGLTSGVLLPGWEEGQKKRTANVWLLSGGRL